MKNEIILRHNPHLAAQALDGYLRQIIPVNQYRSFFYIIETADQIDDGGLACTCRAYQCNCFPGLMVKLTLESTLVSAGVPLS